MTAWDLRTLVFHRNVLFASVPHANVRKWDLDSRDKSQQRAILTCQIGGIVSFLRARAFFQYNITHLQLTSPLFDGLFDSPKPGLSLTC